ncbi:hypothetical protein [Halocatena pleomorpha]|uniref:hypothetical protein n=1 Tax=Halocatena pleomorpha TaxID=1785090 RepID=UPI0016398A72
MFSATVAERDETYVIEVPPTDIEQGALTVETTYRVALLDAPSSTDSRTQTEPQESHTQYQDQSPLSPPVDAGERFET